MKQINKDVRVGGGALAVSKCKGLHPGGKEKKMIETVIDAGVKEMESPFVSLRRSHRWRTPKRS